MDEGMKTERGDRVEVCKGSGIVFARLSLGCRWDTLYDTGALLDDDCEVEREMNKSFEPGSRSDDQCRADREKWKKIRGH